MKRGQSRTRASDSGAVEKVKDAGATDKMNGVWFLYTIHFARDWLEYAHTNTGKLADSLIRGTIIVEVTTMAFSTAPKSPFADTRLLAGYSPLPIKGFELQ